jgi:hypothetical protein
LGLRTTRAALVLGGAARRGVPFRISHEMRLRTLAGSVIGTTIANSSAIAMSADLPCSLCRVSACGSSVVCASALV